MRKSLRGQYKWLVGCSVGMSLLGACALPEDESAAQAGANAQVAGDHDAAFGEVRVSLASPKAALRASDSVSVAVTLTNTGTRPVRLLKWHTPVDGVEEDLFVVTRDGQAVPYVGAHYKRPAPQESDYLTLAPGESLTSTVELSSFYDLSQTGSYRIRFASEAGHAAGERTVVGFASSELSLWIEGRPSRTLEAAGDVVATAGSVSFSGRCSSTQQSTLLQALGAASAMANDSVSYLNGSPAATPRYTTWFGAFSTSGWGTAQTNFVAIKDAFDTKPITLDCSCKKQYYAYVYPNQPYKIYVCSAFWNAPMTGTDSKGGTLIHEMSHFTVVAGTEDYAYGQTNAKALAKSDPAKALDNADNHEYFAENTPFLE